MQVLVENLTHLVNNMSTTVGAGDGQVWVWGWLAKLIGTTAAQTIQWLITAAISGLIIYIDSVQFIRFLQNMGNRNAADPQLKAMSRDSIKQSILIIAIVTIVGGGGFAALMYFTGQYVNPTNP